jgi:hypothetical protein
MTGKPGILFLSHRMEPTGGGEVVAAWMEASKHFVDLLSY